MQLSTEPDEDGDEPLQKELLYVGFNQDQGCFACGTTSGFRIYNCDPFKMTFSRDFNEGGIGIVEMLFRCNILALVGGGPRPQFPPSKVMIWDDYQNRPIGELAFRNPVKAVRLRRDRIVAVLEHRIYVYNFSDLKLLHQIETVSNPKGLVALCPNSRNIVLACPGVNRGHVRIDLYDIQKTTFIACHENNLSAMALNVDGTRLATSSEKGTLIRIFDTHSSQLLRELRRGADHAEIYSLAFNLTSQYVCVSSDKGTLHIFQLEGGALPSGGSSGGAIEPSGGAAPPPAGDAGEQRANKHSNLSFMKSVLPKYFSSEWSFAQFSLPASSGKTLCAFGSEHASFVVVTADGEFYKCTFDPERGGECKNDRYDKFLGTPAA